MCREVSLAELGPLARREMEYLGRETGIRMVDGGTGNGKIPSLRKIPERQKKLVVRLDRKEVSLRLTGRFAKGGRSKRKS